MLSMLSTSTSSHAHLLQLWRGEEQMATSISAVVPLVDVTSSDSCSIINKSSEACETSDPQIKISLSEADYDSSSLQFSGSHIYLFTLYIVFLNHRDN